MKKFTVSDRENMILALQDEIRRSENARYDHRLHGLLLIAQGHSCPEVSRMFGDAPRTVEYWVRRFEERGFAGLVEGERAGRPCRLTHGQLSDVEAALRKTPSVYGLIGGIWDGKTLSAFLAERHGVDLKVRQCQRLFRRFGFRLRKPRPLIAHADPAEQAAHKKTSAMGTKKQH